MKPQRLGAIDAAYLAAELPRAPLHVASLAIFDGAPLLDERGELRLDELRTRIAARLDLLPRLRQRVAFVPFDVARPVWIDDDRFDVSHHVETMAVAAPGDDAALYRLVDDLIMEPLDRDRPLWHLWFITGLEGGRVALLERAHHAMIDGVSGVDVSLVLLDVTEEPPPVTPCEWEPAPAPSPSSLFVDGVIDTFRGPLAATARAVTSVVRPDELRERVADVGSTLATLVRSGLAPPSSINRQIAARRHLSVSRHSLAAVHRVGTESGTTVNDVVLTAVASGLRALALARGEVLPADHEVTVLVPVSVRDASQSMQLGNRVGAYLAPLPTGIGDVRDRLHAIAELTKALKASPEAKVTDGLIQFADLLPPWATNLIGRGVNHQPFVNTVITNVPGPPFPLYAMGARMLEAVPIVPLGGNMTLEVAVLSYDGALTIGITSDTETCPDVDVFVTGLDQGFRELGVEWTPVLTPTTASVD